MWMFVQQKWFRDASKVKDFPLGVFSMYRMQSKSHTGWVFPSFCVVEKVLNLSFSQAMNLRCAMATPYSAKWTTTHLINWLNRISTHQQPLISETEIIKPWPPQTAQTIALEATTIRVNSAPCQVPERSIFISQTLIILRINVIDDNWWSVTGTHVVDIRNCRRFCLRLITPTNVQKIKTRFAPRRFFLVRFQKQMPTIYTISTA